MRTSPQLAPFAPAIAAQAATPPRARSRRLALARAALATRRPRSRLLALARAALARRRPRSRLLALARAALAGRRPRSRLLALVRAAVAGRRPGARLLPVALAAAVLAAPGCGGQRAPASNPPAAKLSQRVRVSGNVPRVRPADFRTPFARYRRYVHAQLGAMLGDVARLSAALAAGDLAGARRAWLAADARYESIGAAYGAFGELDARIDGGTAGLPGGARSPDFTGLHRVELALWGRRSTADAAPAAAGLAADVARLHRRSRRMAIDPLEYTLRAHEVLEGSLDLHLSGQSSPWSGAALVALQANVRGTQAVLGTLAALVARRNRVVLQRSRAALARLDGSLATLRHAHGGTLPRWDALVQRDRERIAGLTADAAERLAFVPELLDPRPPRAVQSPFGETTR
jgi:Imelysin